MSDLTVKIPKLPELDKDDLKAIRSFLPGKLLGRTAALLSLLFLVLGFLAAVGVGLHWFPELEPILPAWAVWVLLALCVLTVAAQIILEWQADRNRAALQQLAIKPGATQTGYFRIGAYSDTSEDREKFSRPDQAEKKVLEWLTRATQVPLYLTGDSGSGKSSLLSASVLPKLRELGWTVIEARVWQDPLDALGKALVGAQKAKRSKADASHNLRDLIEDAARRSKRMLIILDQFEEFIILAKPESRQAFATLVTDLQLRPIRNFTLLLVLRSEYQSLIEDAGLPALRSRENLFQLARFQLSAAEAFMRQSGLDLQPAALDRLLTSAAELDDTPGLVRPITINVIGYVLASGKTVAASLDAGKLLHHYIEQTLRQPAIRDHAPRLLEKMITEQGTKLPRSEQSLATDASLRPAEVRAVLNCLNDAGLARPLEPALGEWELSHDFIARAIVRFLGRRRTKLLRRVVPYAGPALLILALLSGLAAYRVYEQELTIDAIALARAIDVHASLVQDRLTERELMMRVVLNLFRPPSVVTANIMQPLRSSIYAFKTDFVTADWIARLRPDELNAAQEELKKAGFPNPTIRDFDDQPLDIAAIDKPIYVMMDLEPRTPETIVLPGRSFDHHSVIGPMLAQAMAEGKPLASDPFPLLRQNGPIGVALAAPVFQQGASKPAGFVTFSYELGPLMLSNDDLSLFAVVLKDPRDSNDELIANDQGVVTSRTAVRDDPASTRVVTFGNRDWSLRYYAKISAERARQAAVFTGTMIMILGALLLGFVVALMR